MFVLFPKHYVTRNSTLLYYFGSHFKEISNMLNDNNLLFNMNFADL